MLDKYPLAVRPFYTMPDPANEVSFHFFSFFLFCFPFLNNKTLKHFFFSK